MQHLHALDYMMQKHEVTHEDESKTYSYSKEYSLCNLSAFHTLRNASFGVLEPTVSCTSRSCCCTCYLNNICLLESTSNVVLDCIILCQNISLAVAGSAGSDEDIQVRRPCNYCILVYY